MKNQNLLPDEELLTAEDYEKAGRTIAEPKAEKKPSNAGLIVAFVAFNFAFLVVDALSAGVVWALTRWYYGVATLLAGAVFMFVHEFLFSRPFNSARQRNISIGGAVWAILTILFIALCTVVANMAGFFSPQYEPYYLTGMVVVIVGNIVIHGVLTGVFYYIDDGHNATNKSARAVARAKTQNEIDSAAEMILDEALRRRINRKKLIARYRSPQALKSAILEAGGDADEDGIPDNIDPIDNRTGRPFQPARQFSAENKPVRPHEDPTQGGRKD